MNNTNDSQEIKIGISSCLLGEKVRFDSGHKRNQYIMNVLSHHFRFVPYCPEMSIGLGTPREPIRLVQVNQEVRCIGSKSNTLDVTQELIACAEQQRHWHRDLCGYILKKDSPSCGMERVKVYKDDMPMKVGQGMYANKLMDNFPHLPVEEEGRLGDAVLRENFIQRVFVYARWRAMIVGGLRWNSLTEFHANHKYIYMSHNQEMTRELGQWLAENHQADSEYLEQTYLKKMMLILQQRATKKSHSNTLQHIQGYLKNSINKDDKQELGEAITQYNAGLLPLIVPITLLRHHFRKAPNPYITNSFYMKPHPSELMLLNSL